MHRRPERRTAPRPTGREVTTYMSAAPTVRPGEEGRGSAAERRDCALAALTADDGRMSGATSSPMSSSPWGCSGWVGVGQCGRPSPVRRPSPSVVGRPTRRGEPVGAGCTASLPVTIIVRPRLQCGVGTESMGLDPGEGGGAYEGPSTVCDGGYLRPAWPSGFGERIEVGWVRGDSRILSGNVKARHESRSGRCRASARCHRRAVPGIIVGVHQSAGREGRRVVVAGSGCRVRRRRLTDDS